MLHIDITRCKGDECAKSTEIDEFIEQHQIIMLRNEGRYDREEYNEDPIEKFTSLSAHTLAIQRPAIAKSFSIQKVNVF